MNPTLKHGEYYVIYLRKSRQDSEYESVEEVLQRHERQLQDFAIRLTGAPIDEAHIYREIVSGESIDARPEMQKVLSLISDPKCRGVICIDPQRLTRGNLIELGTILSAFQYSRTLVLTPSKIFDLENSFDRDFFERELLRGKDYVDYVKMILARGRNASASEGNWVSSIPAYGYERIKINKDWTLVINEDEAEIVRNVFHWYVHDGLGVQTIANKLNDLGIKPKKSQRWGSSAIRNMLENETYIGKIRWKAKPVVKSFEDGKIVKKRIRAKDYELYDGKHTPIIDLDTFNRAKERRGNNTREHYDATLKNIYAGILKCKKCGGTIAFQSHHASRRTQNEPRKDRLYCRSGKYCDNKSANYDIVCEAILNALKAYLTDFEVELNNDNKKEIQAHERLINRLEKQLQELETKQERLYDLLEKEVYTLDVFKMRNEALGAEREEITGKLKKARLYKPSVEKQQQKYYSLFEAIQAIENPTISAKNKNILLKNIVEVIYFEKDQKDPTTGATLENSVFKIEVILK